MARLLDRAMTERPLPPFPWDWEASGTPSNNGSFNAYLVDATGRKIAAIWGKGSEKEAIADFILESCNARGGNKREPLVKEAAAEQVAQPTLQERLRWLASQTFTHGGGMCNEAADELDRLTAENTRLRAALAVSKSPCVYCSLPAEDWAKCRHGFPGCDRSDAAMGCPELGASLEAKRLTAEKQYILDSHEADRERIRQLVLLLDQANGTPCEQIRHQQDVENLTAINAELLAALEFYADPENYHAIGMFGDPPCGDFIQDASEDEWTQAAGYDRPMPGKIARAAIAKTRGEA